MTPTLREFALPLSSPLATAGGTIEERRGLLVRLEGGVGEATPLPGWTEPFDACREALDDALQVLNTDGSAAALATLEGAPAARHGLALALADREARRTGEPLYRHLGSDGAVTSVPVNATISDAPLDETVGAAREALAAGFDCLKVKVGARRVEEDVERLAAVRDAAGEGPELRADANGAWSRDEARRALEAAAEVDVAAVEQPLPAADLAGHAALREAPVDVALDEALTIHPPHEVLEADAADALILKPMVLGGVDRARDIATAAEKAGVGAVVTTTVDGVVARTGAVHLAASLPDPPASGLATASCLAEDLAGDPAPVTDGRIRVPQAAGIGVEGAR